MAFNSFTGCVQTQLCGVRRSLVLGGVNKLAAILHKCWKFKLIYLDTELQKDANTLVSRAPLISNCLSVAGFTIWP